MLRRIGCIFLFFLLVACTHTIPADNKTTFASAEDYRAVHNLNPVENTNDQDLSAADCETHARNAFSENYQGMFGLSTIPFELSDFTCGHWQYAGKYPFSMQLTLDGHSATIAYSASGGGSGGWVISNTVIDVPAYKTENAELYKTIKTQLCSELEDAARKACEQGAFEIEDNGNVAFHVELHTGVDRLGDTNGDGLGEARGYTTYVTADNQTFTTYS